MINNIQELKAEKKRLQKKRAKLEEKLSGEWVSIKETFKPGKGLKKKGMPFASSSTIRELAKTSMRYGISLLARKISDKASDKLTKLL